MKLIIIVIRVNLISLCTPSNQKKNDCQIVRFKGDVTVLYYRDSAYCCYVVILYGCVVGIVAVFVVVVVVVVVVGTVVEGGGIVMEFEDEFSGIPSEL